LLSEESLLVLLSLPLLSLLPLLLEPLLPLSLLLLLVSEEEPAASAQQQQHGELALTACSRPGPCQLHQGGDACASQDSTSQLH
jgi:hypothetical protein